MSNYQGTNLPKKSDQSQQSYPHRLWDISNQQKPDQSKNRWKGLLEFNENDGLLPAFQTPILSPQNALQASIEKTPKTTKTNFLGDDLLRPEGDNSQTSSRPHHGEGQCANFGVASNFPNQNNGSLSDDIEDAELMGEIFQLEEDNDLEVAHKINRINNEQVEALKEQLFGSKIFLNMVIHDMRSPTTSIKMGLFYTCQLLTSISEQHELHLKSFVDLQPKLDFINRLLKGKRERKSLKSSTERNSSTESLPYHTGVFPDLSELKQDLKELEMEANRLHNEFGFVFKKLKEPDLDMEPESPCFGSEGYQEEEEKDDLMTLDTEEGVILEDNPPALRRFVSHDSHMITDKTNKVMDDLNQILKTQGLDVLQPQHHAKFSKIEQLVRELLTNQFPHPESSFPLHQDTCTQTEPYEVVDAQSQEILNKRISKYQGVLDAQFGNLVQRMKNAQKYTSGIIEEGFGLSSHLDELAHMNTQNELNTQSTLHIMMQQAQDSQKMLHKQIFSQQMMENLINDLLDLAKLENNAFKLSSDNFNLANTVYEALQIVCHTANQSRIALIATTESREDLHLLQSVQGDKRRYMQILLNFLSNAIKFTNSRGSVRVALEVIDHQLVASEMIHGLLNSNPSEHELTKAMTFQHLDHLEDFFMNVHKDSELKRSNSILQELNCEKDQVKEGEERFVSLQIRIIDTGIGISEEGQKNLFINFNKLQESSERNKSGTGLGLSICKKIIEQMGGTVVVKSQLGVGTEFILNMKMKGTVHYSCIDEETRSLIASDEDFVFIRKGFEETELKTCIKDQIAKCFVQQLQKNEQEMQHFSPTPHARKRSSGLPLSQKKSGRVAGEFQFSLTEASRQGTQDSKPSQMDSSGMSKVYADQYFLSRKRKQKVLIANDESMQLCFLKILFTQADFDVTVAQNGFEAFEIIKSSMGETLESIYDLIILDLNMPISNGYEACSQILSYYRQKNIFKIEKEESFSENDTLKQDSASGRQKTEGMLKLLELQPIIIALSAQVDELTLKRTEEVGFHSTFIQPLTADKLRDEILPLVVERQLRMKKRYLLLKYYKMKQNSKSSLKSGQKKQAQNRIHPGQSIESDLEGGGSQTPKLPVHMGSFTKIEFQEEKSAIRSCSSIEGDDLEDMHQSKITEEWKKEEEEEEKEEEKAPYSDPNSPHRRRQPLQGPRKSNSPKTLAEGPPNWDNPINSLNMISSQRKQSEHQKKHSRFQISQIIEENLSADEVKQRSAPQSKSRSGSENTVRRMAMHVESVEGMFSFGDQTSEQGQNNNMMFKNKPMKSLNENVEEADLLE